MPGVNTLRLGNCLSPYFSRAYRAIAERLGQAIGRPVSLANVPEFNADRVLADYDAVFLCGMPYCLLTEARPNSVEILAAPVPSPQRYAGRPIYYSDVIVRRDDPARVFEDLNHRSWCYNDRMCHSGYHAVCARLLGLEQDWSFFDRLTAAGSHTTAIHWVIEGRADGAAIDSHLLDVLRRDDPQIDQRLRVIEHLGPWPIQPVVVASRVSPEEKRRLADTLLELNPQMLPALESALIARFVRVSDSHYDSIRQLIVAARTIDRPQPAPQGDDHEASR